MTTRGTFIAIALFFLAGTAPAQQPDVEHGYWKFHVPKENKPFGNDDVVALAQGRHVATDCSVPWIGGDGNTYCFKDVASREIFLHAPMDYYRQALQAIERERGKTSSSSDTKVPFHQAAAGDVVALDTQEDSRC